MRVRILKFALSFALWCAVSIPVPVHAQLVTNGGFEITTNGPGELGYNTNAASWSTTGYNFLFSPGSADTTGVTGEYGNFQLWGPGNGSSNGLPPTSPAAGNFIAADGNLDSLPVTQTISGLNIGDSYQVGFYWAAGQQGGYFTGATTEQWIVSLGAETQYSPVASIPSEGFSGWLSQSFVYVATAGSEQLSFLAHGTPSGDPPFALLDGVTMSDLSHPNVPEPGSVASMTICGICLGYSLRRRHSRLCK